MENLISEISATAVSQFTAAIDAAIRTALSEKGYRFGSDIDLFAFCKARVSMVTFEDNHVCEIWVDHGKPGGVCVLKYSRALDHKFTYRPETNTVEVTMSTGGIHSRAR
jgi:hypothetical protein